MECVRGQTLTSKGIEVADTFVFDPHDQPFNASTVRRRAARAWKSAKLQPVPLHSARHTYASILIAAGVNAKAITT
jgi:integrase